LDLERNEFPSSERRGGCAEGADGVVIPDGQFETDHPSASRHPYFSRRGINSFIPSSARDYIFGITACNMEAKMPEMR
jgi:hypothetical protein